MTNELALELLDKAYSGNVQYVDPSELEEEV